MLYDYKTIAGVSRDDIVNFDLEPGKKYIVKFDAGDMRKDRSKGIKRGLIFLYVTDYLLVFKTKEGYVETFLRNNLLTKVREQ